VRWDDGPSVAGFLNREVFAGHLSQRTLAATRSLAAGEATTFAKVVGLILASPEMQWR